MESKLRGTREGTADCQVVDCGQNVGTQSIAGLSLFLFLFLLFSVLSSPPRSCCLSHFICFFVGGKRGIGGRPRNSINHKNIFVFVCFLVLLSEKDEQGEMDGREGTKNRKNETRMGLTELQVRLPRGQEEETTKGAQIERRQRGGKEGSGQKKLKPNDQWPICPPHVCVLSLSMPLVSSLFFDLYDREHGSRTWIGWLGTRWMWRQGSFHPRAKSHKVRDGVEDRRRRGW